MDATVLYDLHDIEKLDLTSSCRRRRAPKLRRDENTLGRRSSIFHGTFILGLPSTGIGQLHANISVLELYVVREAKLTAEVPKLLLPTLPFTPYPPRAHSNRGLRIPKNGVNAQPICPSRGVVKTKTTLYTTYSHRSLRCEFDESSRHHGGKRLVQPMLS